MTGALVRHDGKEWTIDIPKAVHTESTLLQLSSPSSVFEGPVHIVDQIKRSNGSTLDMHCPIAKFHSYISQDMFGRLATCTSTSITF